MQDQVFSNIYLIIKKLRDSLIIPQTSVLKIGPVRSTGYTRYRTPFQSNSIYITKSVIELDFY